MNILLVTGDPTISRLQFERLKKLSQGKVRMLNRRKLNTKETIKELKDIDILLAGPSGFDIFDKKIFENLPKLKMVSILAAGTDWIDLQEAKKRNIVVSNAKGANAESVAEHNWGMILSLTKRICEADRNIRLNDESKFINYLGIEVFGKTLGVIGLGEIGKRVVRIAKGFNMDIVGVNKTKKLVKGVKLVSPNYLYKNSDIIVVCVSRSGETINMISNKEIGQMKKGVIIVSSSREDTLDKNAIIKGLESGKIAGYGFDVDILTKVERNNKLLNHPNVIFTPHTAFYTKEADSRIYDVCIDNVEAFLKGKPINTVT